MKGFRSQKEAIWPAPICGHQFYGHKWVQNSSILWLNLIAWGVFTGIRATFPRFPQCGPIRQPLVESTQTPGFVRQMAEDIPVIQRAASI